MVVSPNPILCTVCPLLSIVTALAEVVGSNDKLGLLLSSAVREWIDKQRLQAVPIFSFFSYFRCRTFICRRCWDDRAKTLHSLAKGGKGNKQFCLLHTADAASKHGDLTRNEQRCASLAAIDLCRSRPPISEDALLRTSCSLLLK